MSVAEQVDRAKVLQRLRLGDAAFRHTHARRRRNRSRHSRRDHRFAGIRLVAGAAHVRPELPVRGSWNPVTEKFGAIAPIYGTVVTSFIAMLIAVPVGLFIALFLTELCPMWLRRPIGIAIELLAGIPSIIYGIWGLFVFAPFLQQYVQPFLIAVFGHVPVLSTLFEGPALWHRHPDRRPDPGHHGAAVHHLDLARRVRSGAAGAQGGGLRARLHHLGGGALRGAALSPASA